MPEPVTARLTHIAGVGHLHTSVSARSRIAQRYGRGCE